MKKIKLSQGKFALVDNDDFIRVSQYKWHYHYGYAVRNIKIDGKRTKIQMHRWLCNAEKNIEVDHFDGNGINNQKINLRVCTRSQNMANISRHSDNKSGFKGVCFHKNCNKFRARITINKKIIHLGYFDNARSAAMAYNQAAKEKFGKFSRLNFF